MNYIIFILLAFCANTKSIISNKPTLDQNISISNNIKIAIVNMQKIEENSIAIKGVEKKIQQTERKIMNELISKKTDIEKKFKGLQEKRATLSKEVIESKAASIELEFNQLQQEERKKMQAFDFAKNAAIKDFTLKISQSSSKIAEEEGVSFVFPSSVFLYYNQDNIEDITLKVVHDVNSSFKSIDFDAYFDNALALINNSVKKK